MRGVGRPLMEQQHQVLPKWPWKSLAQPVPMWAFLSGFDYVVKGENRGSAGAMRCLP